MNFIEEWREVYSEDLHDFSSPGGFLVMKSSRIRWAEHVVGTGGELGGCGHS
jgi:hypothetical protein